jgi:endoglucanase
VESRTWSSRQIVAVSAAGGLAFLAIVAWVISLLVTGNDSNPLKGADLYVNPDSSASKAAASATGGDAEVFGQLAEKPTATWLLPEQHPTGEIESYVTSIVAAAAESETVPVLTVYGVPNRDCSNQSAGGTTDEDYPRWVSAIAAGLTDREAIVILEPDSLGLASQCGSADARVAHISSAIDALTAPGLSKTSIYLDGGHSTWIGVDAQAELLNRAGVERVRGFATNVSNFNSTADEIAYGNSLSDLTGGAHFVIDTSRNGNGTNGDWCNPIGRAIGDPPGSTGDEPHDGNLWIKNPGESDGECNGGPTAGTWWPEGARALVSD